MGHLGHLKEEYRALLYRLDAGPVGLPMPEDLEARQAWRELLEIFYTPAEAAIAARMPMRPTSLKRLAARFKKPPEALERELEPLCDKGLIMDIVDPSSGKTRYVLSPPVIGFFEFSMMRAHDMFPKKRVAEAMDAYMHRDPAFAQQVFGHDTVVGRALVHEDRLAPDVLPDVLDWERATEIVQGARSVAVSLCYCRHKAEHLGRDCDTPKELCLSLNGGADFVSRRGFGRAIERSEALDTLQQARKAGLVQIADNVRDQPAYICNCCGCCCAQLRAINDYDLAAVNPSGFHPEVDSERCKGCSKCSRACPITAISMRPERRTSRRKSELRPALDLDRCIGCGVCATACTKGAMTMVAREERTHVPRDVIERVVRVAIERGRLSQLLFDAGEGRGTAFLNQLLSTIEGLPLAKRLMANEQAQSRFVRRLLSGAGAGK